jgi:hypothetical protein
LAPQPPVARTKPPERPPAADPKTTQQRAPAPPVVQPQNQQAPSEPPRQALNDAQVVRPAAPEPQPQPRSFSGFGQVNVPSTVTPAPAPRPAPAAVMTPELQQILVQTIRYADAAEIEAKRTFNVALLVPFYGPEYVKTHLANLQENARNQIVQLSQLHRQSFEYFWVSPDGMRAQVRVTEYWSDQYYSTVTRQCVSRINERPVPQTISLLATTDGWKIITVEFHDKSEAQVVQCR